jgi:type VI protein secretion system component Hcp
MAETMIHGDMIMIIIDPDTNKPLVGESALTLHKDDTEALEFHGKSYFEIEELNLGVSLGGLDRSASGLQSKLQRQDRAQPNTNTRTANVPQLTDPGLPTQLHDVTFKKQVDAASPLLFLHCCTRRKIKQATLLRRKTIGGVGKEVHSETFLRLDFMEVQLSDIRWELGSDSVDEEVTLTCRGIKMIYRPQRKDGKLGDAMGKEYHYNQEQASGR